MLCISIYIHIRECVLYERIFAFYKVVIVSCVYVAYVSIVQYFWDRALGLPLERPKSVTSEWINKKFA
jgi:hypothetical protein